MCRPTLAELPETLISCSQSRRWGYGGAGSLAFQRHSQVRHPLTDLGRVCGQATSTRNLMDPAPPRQVQRDKLFNLGLIQSSVGSAQSRPAHCSKEGQDHLGAKRARTTARTATGRPSVLLGSLEDSQVTGPPTATMGGVAPPPSRVPANFRTCARVSAPAGQPGAPLPPPTVSRHAPRRKGRSRQ